MKNSPLPLIVIGVIVAAIVSVEGGVGTDSGDATSTTTRSYIYRNEPAAISGNTQNTPSSNTSETPTKQASPYSKWVSLSSYKKSQFSSAPGDESITLSLSSRAPGPVTISGWQIWSVGTGNRATILQGTSYVHERNNLLTPIVLNPGEKAVIYSGNSPLETSFKYNMCLPYLRNTRNFPSSIGSRCPDPADVAFPLPFFDKGDECTDYIETLRSCEAPHYDSDFPDGISDTCADYVRSITGYDNCVELFKTDSKFFKKEWWVFLGKPSRMYATRGETILLFDENGILVDEY